MRFVPHKAAQPSHVFSDPRRAAHLFEHKAIALLCLRSHPGRSLFSRPDPVVVGTFLQAGGLAKRADRKLCVVLVLAAIRLHRPVPDTSDVQLTGSMTESSRTASAVEERLRLQIDAYHASAMVYAAAKLGLADKWGLAAGRRNNWRRS